MSYEPTAASIRQHRAPDWYHDAKFGIFIHWGPFSIPAYAPLGHGDVNEILSKDGYRGFFDHIPYSEWYANSIRIPDSPAWELHRRVYGADASYFDFAPLFKRTSASWQAEPWADLFRAVGARYVVLVTKHMDGFLLWPSATPHYERPGYLLLNIGRMPDGTIPELQVGLLRGLGACLAAYGDALYGTRPWRRAEGRTTAGGRVRFTHKTSAEGETLYVLFLDAMPAGPVTVADLRVAERARIHDVATREALDFHQNGGDLTLVVRRASDAPARAVAIHSG